MAQRKKARTPHQEVDFAKLSGGPWDGRRYSYIPKMPLKISPSLKIFSGAKPADPVTYQVVRWKLWGLNLEHADTIKRVSGSALIVYIDDFATSILTGAGDNIVMSPTIQYFGGMSDLVVKWTLENRSENPGIEDGDIFLQNDPYIGTAHQIDTGMYGPVFWKGALFCWVFSSCHVGDIGGIEAGSLCGTARDIFDEPLAIPPIKIARKGVLQSDVVDMFTRQSRTPEMIALQLRSQLAGFTATRDRILAMLEHYGPAVVAGVMAQIVDDCDKAVSRRLKSIPDGEWTDRVYVGGIVPGDRGVHKLMTTVRKVGDQLICSNAGTAPQVASGNGTYGSWRSVMLCAATNILAYDQMGCPSGVLRHLRFDPTPGTFNCAVHPAAVTTLNGTLAGSVGAGQVLSNMVLSGPPALHGNARTVGGGSSHGLWSVTWTEKGAFMANMTGDTVASAIGASGARDGVDQGGPWLTPTNVAGDVEEWEDATPLLYLYRQSAVDSGGVGRYRGGNGLDTAMTSHKAENVHGHMHGSDAAINLEHGLSGGFPGRSGDYTIVADSNVRDLFAGSNPPANPRELKERMGVPTRLHARAIAPMGSKDVLLVGHPASGGVGDPLLRPPEMVAKDVVNGEVSATLARHAYGVEFDGDGNVDAAATAARRAQLRAKRLHIAAPEARPQSDRKVASGARIRPVGTSLVAVGDKGWSWGCAHCRRLLGPLTGNYKLACRVISESPQKIDSERFPDPKEFSDADMVARQFLCPGCGTLLAFEFCLRDDPPLQEIRIDEAWLASHADDEAKPLAAE